MCSKTVDLCSCVPSALTRPRAARRPDPGPQRSGSPVPVPCGVVRTRLSTVRSAVSSDPGAAPRSRARRVRRAVSRDAAPAPAVLSSLTRDGSTGRRRRGVLRSRLSRVSRLEPARRAPAPRGRLASRRAGSYGADRRRAGPVLGRDHPRPALPLAAQPATCCVSGRLLTLWLASTADRLSALAFGRALVSASQNGRTVAQCS